MPVFDVGETIPRDVLGYRGDANGYMYCVTCAPRCMALVAVPFDEAWMVGDRFEELLECDECGCIIDTAINDDYCSCGDGCRVNQCSSCDVCLECRCQCGDCSCLGRYGCDDCGCGSSEDDDYDQQDNCGCPGCTAAREYVPGTDPEPYIEIGDAEEEVADAGQMTLPAPVVDDPWAPPMSRGEMRFVPVPPLEDENVAEWVSEECPGTRSPDGYFCERVIGHEGPHAAFFRTVCRGAIAWEPASD